MVDVALPVYPKLEAKLAEKGLNYSNLATILEISVSGASRRMRGELDFDLNDVMKLINFFDCEFSELF